MNRKICVLASGGDAPGMNACFEAVFIKGTTLGFDVYASVAGYDGLINDNFVKMTTQNACGISIHTGCAFKSSRSPKFMTHDGFARAVATVKKHKFESLIIIGGNGSFTGAGRLKAVGIPVIAIPATIDNDVFFTKHNLGFSSACENAIEMVDYLRGTMETNDRDFVVQLMGRHCTQLAHTVGVAAFADIIDMDGGRHTPEMAAEIFAQKRKQGKTSSFMIMQERKNEDAVAEALDSANYLKGLWAASGGKDIRMNTLGHLQRGAKPSCRDRYLGVVYGHAALDCINKQQFGVGVGLAGDSIIYHEIPLAPVP